VGTNCRTTITKYSLDRKRTWFIEIELNSSHPIRLIATAMAASRFNSKYTWTATTVKSRRS
jgi:hypothetical protein